MAQSKYTVKFVQPYRWSIWCDGKILDGGFFSKIAAEEYLWKEYLNDCQ